MRGAVAAGELGMLGLQPRQVGLQALHDGAVLHVGGGLGAGVAGAALGVGLLGLRRGQLTHDGVQAAGFQVHAVFGGNDALLLLEGRQLALRRFELAAQALQAVVEEGVVLARRFDAQLDVEVDVGARERVRRRGGELGSVPVNSMVSRLLPRAGSTTSPFCSSVP